MKKFAFGFILGGIAVASTPVFKSLKAIVDIAIEDVSAEHEAERLKVVR